MRGCVRVGGNVTGGVMKGYEKGFQYEVKECEGGDLSERVCVRMQVYLFFGSI